MKREYFQIAVDGFSSCGKSTIARMLATKLSVTYVDSGAMYRAFAWYMMDHGEAISEDNATRMIEDFDYQLQASSTGGGSDIVWVRGRDVSEAIRSVEVAQNASRVAQYSCVRHKLVDLQRQLANSRSIIMEGRDIGTVVFPDAQLKVFLTADFARRAERRWQELKDKGQQISLDDVCDSLHKRDTRDTERAESPLVKAADAIPMDTTNLSLNEALAMLEALAKARLRDFF